jgi:hypothetical protein
VTRRRHRLGDAPHGPAQGSAPRPDHGAVWVRPWVDEPHAFWHTSWEDETGPLWHATWEDEDRRLECPPGSRDRTVAWAYAVPAAWRLVLSPATKEWVELRRD